MMTPEDILLALYRKYPDGYSFGVDIEGAVMAVAVIGLGGCGFPDVDDFLVGAGLVSEGMALKVVNYDGITPFYYLVAKYGVPKEGF